MLERFTVIDLIKTRSDSVCTITGNVVKFNTQTAQEFNYAPFVQFLIDTKGKQFAIRVCKEGDPNCVSFSKPEGQQRYPIKISNAAVVDMIRKLMNWNAEDNWNIPGIYFAEEQALVYNLAAAYEPKAKGGWTAKREREAAAAAAAESMSEAEKEEETPVTPDADEGLSAYERYIQQTEGEF